MPKTKSTKFFNANITITDGKVYLSEALQSVNVNQYVGEVRKVNSRKLARLVNRGEIVIK